MCNRTSGARAPTVGARQGSDRFFGLDVDNMSPRTQVAAALAVLVPVALGATVVLSLVPEAFWLVFVFGWMVFPGFGLLVRGLAGLSTTPPERRVASVGSRERELLEALRKHGEITPARAAMETSLSVTEAEEMLKDLAAGGHLEVRTRGMGLSYAMWTSPTAPVGQDLEALPRARNVEQGEAT